MTITKPTAPIELRQVMLKGKDVLGQFYPYDRQRIVQAKSLPDRKYSSTLRCLYLPDKDFHLQSIQNLFKLDSFPPPHLDSSSETIAETPAQDEPTGISSSPEELSLRASIKGQTEAADLQEPKNNNLDLFFRPKPSLCGFSVYHKQETFRPVYHRWMRDQEPIKIFWIPASGHTILLKKRKNDTKTMRI